MPRRKSEEAEPDMEDFEESGLADTEIAATEFNLEEEYKPTPLIPNAVGYHAYITDAKYERKGPNILLEWTLKDNGGYCSDGETAIDGRKQWQRLWLPKPGDEKELTKSGDMTKRQSKINMLTKALQSLKIKAVTLADLLEKIANSELIGLEGKIDIGLDTWQGQTSNKVTKSVAV